MRAKLSTLAGWLGVPSPELPELTVSGVSTDSRTIEPGQLFVALSGERFNGASFIAAAAARGAAAAVGGPGYDGSAGIPVLEVADALDAYGQIAAGWRRGLDLPVIAITGSSGKTTTKDIIRGMLETRRLVATEGSENNEVGLPRTVLRMDGKSEVACLEMGMRGLGQIKELCLIARPEVGVITNIGPAHLEHLGDMDTVMRGKAELIEQLPASGTAVLNADDERCLRLTGSTDAAVVTFGFSRQADYRAVDIKCHEAGSSFRAVTPVGESSHHIDLVGRFQISNCLAAMAAVRAAGFSAEALNDTLAVPLSANRGQVIELNGVTFVFDCYNANPHSMAASLEAFAALPGSPNIAVLGEMAELGEESRRYHVETGAAAAAAGLDVLIVYGSHAEEQAAAARQAGLAEVIACPGEKEAELAAESYLKPGARLLFKASRVARLEEVAQRLMEVTRR